MTTFYRKSIGWRPSNKLYLKFISLLCFLLIFFCPPSMVLAQVSPSVPASTHDHNKQVIGYITQWGPWKDIPGLIPKGSQNQINIDYSQYTILNYSFFGVAVDGSLHSGDYRNKNIYQEGSIQQPAPLIFEDIYSSWDKYLLYGELDIIQYISDGSYAYSLGYRNAGSGWTNVETGESGPFPLAIHKEGGRKGLLALCKENGVKALASIGGWSMCKHFPEVAADPVKRKRFIDDCKKLIELGFDGIDLDWEYPGHEGMNFEGTAADFENFAILTEEIRAAIGSDKLITSCFTANPAKLIGFDWGRITQSLDYFNMMTYDFNGGWSNIAGHNSPLYDYPGAEYPGFSVDDAAQAMIATGVPRHKINLGAAFYGRGVITDGAADLGTATVKRNDNVQPDGPIVTSADYTNWPKDVWDGTPNYNAIVHQTSNWTEHWDDVAKVPYKTNGNFFLSYDNERSIEEKAKYINTHNLGGVIIWHVAGDWMDLSSGAQSLGGKLVYSPNTKAPLLNKINEVFSNGSSGNQSPVVSITSPSNNATFASGASITIQANATDGDGTISKVEFFNGSTKLGEDTSSPYTYTWTGAADGNYSLTAKATDDKNAVATSTAVKITIGEPTENTPPTVSITAPANGAEFKEGETITITASANDSDGSIAKVDFFNDGTKLGESSTAPYTFVLSNATAGSYSFTATATDDQGASTTSAAVAIVVTPTSNPGGCDAAQYVENGGYAAGSQVQNEGNVYTCKDYPYSGWCNGAAWAYAPGSGAHWQDAWTLTGECTGGDENQAPSANITSPSNNATFQVGQTITITANASDSDGTITKVEFLVNGTVVGESTTSPYTYTWENATAGSHNLTVRATDNEGASTTSSDITVVINGDSNGTPPTVSITSPANGATLNEGNVTITVAASDSDGAITKVEFFNGTQKLGESTSSPFSFNWTASAGSYVITAKATDNSGATATSPAVNITIKGSGNCDSNYKIVGYMPSWQGSAQAIQYDKLTHVMYAFIRPTTTGGLTAVENPQKLRDIVSLAHAQNVKVSIAVGGWSDLNNTDFESMAANPTYRANFINNLLNMINEYQLDGVDMDWEYPIEGNDPQNFATLMNEMATALHAKGKILTAAVSAHGYYAGGVLNSVFQDVDFLNLMAYDGGDGASHSPYSYAELSLNYWLDRGLPAEKAIIGVPFYARPSWASYKDLLAQGADPFADVYNGSYYNGITTMKAKAELAKQRAGGIMIWEVSQDASGQYSLLTAINEVLKPCDGNNGTSPTVSITSPANGATFASGATVAITAQASDADGNVTQVEFLVNGAVVGTDNAAPFTANWTAGADGSYALTARATDNEGNATTSAAITITVGSSTCSVEAWNASAVYTGGNQVSYEGNIYQANWWSQGDNPAQNSGQWAVWTLIGPCGTTVNAANSSGTALAVAGSATGSQEHISVYPNPSAAGSVINIALGNNVKEAKVLIQNLNGTKVFENTYKEVYGHLTINAPSLPEGMYIIKVVAGGNSWTEKHLIK